MENPQETQFYIYIFNFIYYPFDIFTFYHLGICYFSHHLQYKKNSQLKKLRTKKGKGKLPQERNILNSISFHVF